MNSHAQKALPLRGIALLASFACAAAFLLALAQPAAAELSFCPPGSGAGECSNPGGVATDFETGRVYVADRDNSRVNVFESDGEFVMAFGWGVDTGASELQKCTTASGCLAGIAGSAAGQLTIPRQIAVDNVTGSANRHDVYVVTGDFRWQRFGPDGSFLGATGWGVDTGAAALQSCTIASTCQAGINGGGECQLDDANVGNVDPIAIGPAGNVVLADTTGNEPNLTDRVQKLSPAGACLGETVLIEGNALMDSLAIDSSEDAYVSVNRMDGQLFKYDLGTPKTKLCDLDPGIGTSALGIDDAGRLFAAQGEPRANGFGAFSVITEYDGPACEVLHRFGYGEIEGSVPGLAVLHTPEGDLFASERDGEDRHYRIHYLTIPDPGPIVPPESLKADPVKSVWAAIKAEVNPEGKATTYRVDWVDQKSFEDEGGFSSPDTRSGGDVALEATSFRVQAAEAIAGCKPFSETAFDEGKCLAPETEYRYRVVATNADGADEVEGSFTTRSAIEIGDVYATDVGTDAATLNAEVNPLGAPATGHFEYVTEAEFQANGFTAPSRYPSEGEIDLGLLETPSTYSAPLFPLSPDTSYRYRFVVDNLFIAEPIASEVRSFKTFAPEPPSSGQCPANEAFRTGASAFLPDCRAYELVTPLDKANGDIVVFEQLVTLQPAVLNQSAVSGDKLTYGSYRAFGDAPSASYTSQYIASRDPAGWQSHAITPSQTDSINGGAEFDFEFRAFSDDLCEAWVTPLFEPVLAEGGIPGVRNLYRQSDDLCGGPGYEAISTAAPEHPKAGTEYFLELQGLSEDRTIAAFAGTDSLEGSGAPSNTLDRPQLYIKGPETQPRYACILPGGALAKECTAGSGPAVPRFMRGANVTGALSADGKRIFWTATSGGQDQFGGEGPIYLRENPLAEGPECLEEGSPCTVVVSKAAETLSKTTTSHFWAAAKDGSAAIFTTGPIQAGADLYAYDAEAKATEKIAGGVLGILGQSEDLSRVYFASTEVLSGEAKNSEGAKAEAGKANLYLHEAGPGGGTDTFIGVLNADDAKLLAGSSRGESSATAAAPNHHNGRVSPDGLHAAFMSRAPLTGYDNTDAKSGVADTEVFLFDAAAGGGAGEILCASCNPSGARPAGVDASPEAGAPFWIAARLPVYSTTLHAPEVLSEDGSRLFFESQDPLVVRDTNSRIDVYQWERPGSGDCEEGEASFSAEAGGCVELISSGQSKRNSEFLDASSSGDDVFFTTLAGLVPQDYGLVDIYDARTGGGLPPPPPPGPECEGEACQSPPAPPELSTPATKSTGPGDPVAKSKTPARCPKGKRKARKGGKTRCLPRKAKRRAATNGRAKR